MHPQWLECLATHGGGRQVGHHVEFGTENSPPERNRAVIVPLVQRAVIAITGEERQGFLQGQLTNDTTRLSVGSAQWTAFCSPKGRVLANGPLAAAEDGWAWWVDAGIAETTAKRLSMFVLRTKARIAVPEGVALGAIGEEAIASLAQALALDAPDAALTVSGELPTHLIRLDGPTARAMAWMPVETACRIWPALAQSLPPAASGLWDRLDIEAGQAWVDANTREHLIPQSLNLDLLGAVNFKKGCYVGQEIVARTAYLGTLKRRMFQMSAAGAELPPTGTDVIAAGQPVGEVITAAIAPPEGIALLVSARLDAVESDGVVLPDGRALRREELSYGGV